MEDPRKLMLTAVACGVALGLLGGAQVNTTMNPSPDGPFRWAEGVSAPTEAMRFADSVPLDLDVPDDFQLRSVSLEGDRTPDWQISPQPRLASLGLAQYRVDNPAPLPPEPAVIEKSSPGREGVARMDAMSAAESFAGPSMSEGRAGSGMDNGGPTDRNQVDDSGTAADLPA